MAYKAPIWEDGRSPAISAENLNNLSRAAEGAQVLYGNSAPTSSTEGAVGQFYLVVVADANGNYALYQCVGISGSAYNWELLGTTPAYAKVSNPVAQTLRIPSGSSVEFALISNFAPIKIASYETAGSYTWTAPDLADGKAYIIGVLIIGAGASGRSSAYNSSTSYYLSGGPSGFTNTITERVLPGGTKNLVVGAGGKGVSVTSFSGGSNGGGTSSFDGVTAAGGENPNQSNHTSQSVFDGSNPGRYGGGIFGGALRSGDKGHPTQCLNPFENTRILGAGGGAGGKSNYPISFAGGKDPVTGLGGGNGKSGAGKVTGGHATAPGCGGGAAFSNTAEQATGGNGADGAVYIYFLGVADE